MATALGADGRVMIFAASSEDNMASGAIHRRLSDVAENEIISFSILAVARL